MEIQTPDRQVRLAVDLVNTRTLDPEQLTAPEDLRAFLLDHGESEPITLDEDELLAEYAVRPYLSDHDGSPWHLHVAKPGASWAEWMAATTALGLASFAAGHGFKALGTCAAVDCERVFVNPAERRQRRFCTPTCASRTRVASYRARARPRIGGVSHTVVAELVASVLKITAKAGDSVGPEDTLVIRGDGTPQWAAAWVDAEGRLTAHLSIDAPRLMIDARMAIAAGARPDEAALRDPQAKLAPPRGR